MYMLHAGVAFGDRVARKVVTNVFGRGGEVNIDDEFEQATLNAFTGEPVHQFPGGTERFGLADSLVDIADEQIDFGYGQADAPPDLAEIALVEAEIATSQIVQVGPPMDNDGAEPAAISDSRSLKRKRTRNTSTKINKKGTAKKEQDDEDLEDPESDEDRASDDDDILHSNEQASKRRTTRSKPGPAEVFDPRPVGSHVQKALPILKPGRVSFLPDGRVTLRIPEDKRDM